MNLYEQAISGNRGVRPITLPIDFLYKMKDLLQDEYDPFVSSYEEQPSQGLRINPLKSTIQDFMMLNPFQLTPIPWTKQGFYYGEEDRPGKHPFHEAGLYYIQEPSAMAVAEIMDVNPGEKVLDLAAAPGGKTTHLAGKMNHQGLLVANEIHPKRARILSQNVERMGIRNTVVTNESPERLVKRFPLFFDHVLVDAPCSGEGMFRKNPDVCQEWTLNNVNMCAVRQIDILEAADSMLRVGGQLVYSTCTFSPEENEQVVSDFIKSHPEYDIVHIDVYEGFSRGRPDWIKNSVHGIEQTVRIWPHQVHGEGHFIAVLRKTAGHPSRPFKGIQSKKNKSRLKDFYTFAKETLTATPDGKFILFGNELYIVPDEMVPMDKLKVLRPGWHLGSFKKNRFEPSHALALSLEQRDVKFSINVSQDSSYVSAYLKGETIQANGENGWHLVTVDGYSLGWGKLTGQTLKNHYPKGLRWPSQ